MSVPCLSKFHLSAHPAEGRESAARLQEPGRHAHHQWLLPVASCGMEHWRVGGFAAFALTQKKSPRQIRNQKPLLADFQRFVQDQGIEIAWPKLTPR